MAFKKFKEKEARVFHDNDLILMYSLLNESKAKTLFKNQNKTFEEIREFSRFNTKLNQNPDIEQKIKEFLMNNA